MLAVVEPVKGLDLAAELARAERRQLDDVAVRRAPSARRRRWSAVTSTSRMAFTSV
jgi:hypothetical protein